MSRWAAGLARSNKAFAAEGGSVGWLPREPGLVVAIRICLRTPAKTENRLAREGA